MFQMRKEKFQEKHSSINGVDGMLWLSFEAFQVELRSVWNVLQGLKRCSQVLLATRPKAVEGACLCQPSLKCSADAQVVAFCCLRCLSYLVYCILNLLPLAPNCQKSPLITHQNTRCLSDLNSPLTLPVLTFDLILPLAKYRLIFPV